MTANMTDSRTFFTDGTPAQYEYVYSLYEEALKCKASQKNKKEADYVKLDRWFQVELPKKIKSRGKDAHLVHEELVQCMKWKMSRGKFIPRIKDLVQMNTPRLCITETKKSFRALLKKDDLTAAIQAMCNLKGVGPAMASVMLTAADPNQCGFMADECLMAIPEIDSIDYTTKELLNFVEQLRTAAARLNMSGGSNWNAHKVEQTVWTHVVLNECKKELLEGMPSASARPTANGTTDHQLQKNGDGESSTDSTDAAANKENLTTNGATALDEDSNTCDSVLSTNTTEGTPVTSFTASAPPLEEDTNDSIATTGSGRASSHAEEDSINTASPQQQVSEDTNDSIPQEGSSERSTLTQNGNGHISNSEVGTPVAAPLTSTTVAESTLNDTTNASESVSVVSTTSTSLPESSGKLSSPVVKLPLKDAVDSEEPSS